MARSYGDEDFELVCRRRCHGSDALARYGIREADESDEQDGEAEAPGDEGATVSVTVDAVLVVRDMGDEYAVEEVGV